ncbi:MAG: methyltransferase domain-containing protein [Acidobacteria bacterium]|nr:methyltransferase domain-containing protein [Acidobacteriota bacterium]
MLATTQRTRPVPAELAAAAAAARSGDPARFARSLEAAREAIRDYLLSFELAGAPRELTSNYVGDALSRFLHTLAMVPLPPPGRILEIGAGPYFFHLLLRRVFPDSTVEGVNFYDHDIFSTAIGKVTQVIESAAFGERHEFTYPTFNLETVARYPYPPDTFDLIFFCETLEHLVVNPLAVFRKLRRILRPGGALLVTLPNALRLTNFGLMLEGCNFFDFYHPGNGVHGRHNREFTLSEVRTLLELNGFAVARSETLDRFDYEVTPFVGTDYAGRKMSRRRRKSELLKILRAAGGDLADRGDNLYLLARKPPRRAPAAPPDGPRPAGPVRRPPPQGESRRVEAFVDELEDLPDRLGITGWAFLTDGRGAAEETVDLVLASAEACYHAACEKMHRDDVAAAHGLEAAAPGFHLDLAKAGLAPGRYRLGVSLGGGGLEPGFRWLGFETSAG